LAWGITFSPAHTPQLLQGRNLLLIERIGLRVEGLDYIFNKPDYYPVLR
jgi:hypothetical protein